MGRTIDHPYTLFLSLSQRISLVSRHRSVSMRHLSHVLTSVTSYFLAGGMKEIALHTSRQFLRGLVGCISHFTLSTDYHISLVEDAMDGKNIHTCGAK